MISATDPVAVVALFRRLGAPSRLTTAVAIKLDPVRHSPEVVSQLEEAMKRHKGGIEVFLQVQTGPESKVTMRLNKERFVKPTRELVDDLDLLLGSGSVQLCGAGTKSAPTSFPVILS